MKITWNGHSCFTLESGGQRLILDPYTLENYPPLHLEGNEVYCSHGHRDHAFTEAVTLAVPEKPVFRVAKLATFHDGEKGALRGSNTVHVIEAEGLRVVHCGDLGHLLGRVQVAALGRVDALLIPVGGFYTIDAAQAKETVEAVAPRVTVPMHYRHGEYGLRPVGEVEDFLRLFAPETVQRLEGNSFELTKDAPCGVIVPRFVP